ncbi:MAG TPA: DUF4160 domain-containing protein [Bacteroidetes bacterium]|nr:DUF4160 domain-containing protein [Bacteroidota bacterium]
MPTIRRIFFYAGDGTEPRHVHVQRKGMVAKIWLNPVRLHSSGGFRPPEIGKVLAIVEEYEAELLEAWHDYFGGRY